MNDCYFFSLWWKCRCSTSRGDDVTCDHAVLNLASSGVAAASLYFCHIQGIVLYYIPATWNSEISFHNQNDMVKIMFLKTQLILSIIASNNISEENEMTEKCFKLSTCIWVCFNSVCPTKWNNITI